MTLRHVTAADEQPERSPIRTSDLAGILHLPDEAKVVWAPAHHTNFAAAGSGAYGGAPRRFVAVCLHTPEEEWDDYELTPELFARPNFDASTGYYADSDGDLYQMVRDRDFAWAQGTLAKDLITPRPSWWRNEYVSYNACMLSIEIEGRAHQIQDTFLRDSRQFQAVAAWLAYVCTKYDIPIRRSHIVGHSELTTQRRDPGNLFPWTPLLQQARNYAAAYNDSSPQREQITHIETRLNSEINRRSEAILTEQEHINEVQAQLDNLQQTTRTLIAQHSREISRLKARIEEHATDAMVH